MIPKNINPTASLAELTSNPKSFANCPDLHGGVPDLISDVGDHVIPEALVWLCSSKPVLIANCPTVGGVPSLCTTNQAY
jgi:hypothetical protein